MTLRQVKNDRPTRSIKAKNARGEKFTSNAGIVHSRLGRHGGPSRITSSRFRRLLAQGKGIVNTAKACAPA
jgi:hypothetical protein